MGVHDSLHIVHTSTFGAQFNFFGAHMTAHALQLLTHNSTCHLWRVYDSLHIAHLNFRRTIQLPTHNSTFGYAIHLCLLSLA